MIKIKKPSEATQAGALILIYGPTWVGKTYSSLQSLMQIGKTLFVPAEPRGDNVKIMKEIGFTDEKGDYAPYGDGITIDDVIETLSSSEECAPYKCIFYDGLSYTMGFTLQDEVTQQDHAGRQDKGSVGTKVLASKTKMSQESHGIVNGLVKRLIKALGRRANEGKIVVISALDDTQFKWGDSYVGGPALTGKEVPRLLPPLFDYIGYVEPRFKVKDDKFVLDKKGNQIKEYPPIVHYESDGSFVAKGGGVGLLDFNKMLNKKHN